MESCPSMDDLNSDRWAHFPPSQLVKLSILVLLLLLVFGFNLFLLLKPSPQGRRKTACDLLVTTLATVGLVNGLLNLLPYLVSTVTGDRILGDTFCQFQGLFGEVTIGVWRWGLVIASCERYLRLLDPYEHQSYFSLLNTKVIIGGMVLLLFVIHMGPVYGWGEYSTFRGNLDLTLTIKENTSTLGPEGLQLATAYLNTLPHTPDSPISNLSTYLQDVRKVILHRPHPGPRGLILPLRASSGDALTCLWAQYLNGSLVESVQDLLLSNLSSAIPGVPEFELVASIQREDFLMYRDIYIPYQGDQILGDTFCQFQGLFGEVTIGIWRWGLVIASCERYLRLLDPYKHQSYFSLLNTKLIIGVMVLLLFVIHMGPLYGWGKLDLTLTIKENTSILGPEGLQLAASYISTLHYIPNSPISNLSTYLQDVRKVVLHRPHPGPRGLILTLRASSGDALAPSLAGSASAPSTSTCLWWRVNKTCSSPTCPREFELAASIQREDFLAYKDVYIPSQGIEDPPIQTAPDVQAPHPLMSAPRAGDPHRSRVDRPGRASEPHAARDPTPRGRLRVSAPPGLDLEMTFGYSRLWSIDRRGKEPGELRDPRDVCFIPGKDRVVVADAGNHRLQVFSADASSVELFDRKENHCLSHPGALAMSRDQFHIVTADGDRVHFIDRTNGECTNHWAPTPPHKDDRRCIRGMALDADDNFILTSFGAKTTVELYSQTTSKLMRALSVTPDFRCPSHVACNRKTGLIYVSDSEQGVVCVFDKRAKRCVRQLGKEGKRPCILSPHGLCFDTSGCLYVADKAKNSVALFAGDHTFSEYVVKETDGLKDPIAVAISDSRKIAVAACTLDFGRDHYAVDMYEQTRTYHTGLR